MNDQLIDKIRKLDLESDQFGLQAHLKMSHTGRRFYPKEGENVREAGVTHLIYPKADQLHFSLIRRTSKNPNDRHGGQVGLAGGALELADKDIQEAAIRELYEEVGVSISKNNIIRPLSALYIPVSGFHVFPFLALIDAEPSFRLQEEEVEYLIEVPLNELFNDKNKAIGTMNINQKFALKKVPHYNFFGHIVWGATAMMLSELEALLLASNYPSGSN